MGLRDAFRRAESAVEDAGATVKLSAAVSVAALVIALIALVVAIRR